MAFVVTKLYPTVGHGNEVQIALANIAHTSTYPTGGETVDFSPAGFQSLLDNILLMKGRLITSAKTYELIITKGADWASFNVKLFTGGVEETNGTTVTSTSGYIELYLGRRVA